jgi:hypothetical protein
VVCCGVGFASKEDTMDVDNKNVIDLYRDMAKNFFGDCRLSLCK